MAVFFRLVGSEDKAAALRAATDATGAGGNPNVYIASPSDFGVVPRSPFAYWVNSRILGLFAHMPALAARGATATVGLQSSDDLRFLRLSWEPRRPAQFPTFAKGGSFGRYYSDLYLRVLWGTDGAEIKAFAERTPGSSHWSRNIRSAEHYFRPGLTWPRRTNGLSIRVMPSQSAFADKGPALFIEGDRPQGLCSLAALANSRPFEALVSLQLARTVLAQSFDVGIIQRTPVPELAPSDEITLASLAKEGWSLRRGLDTRTETSHAFTLPALLQVHGDTLAARAAAWGTRVRAIEDELDAIQVEIDARCFALYGMSDNDRRSITESFGASTADSDDEAGVDASVDDDEEAEADTTDTATLAAELLSWAVGVALGRFDVRLATGARELPGEPEPFDPLPVCSPGMLTGADGLSLETPPAGYALAFPADGVLVDDEGHPRDLVAAIRAVFDVVFAADADLRWQEAAALLDPQGHDLRAWFRAGFFEHHLRRYSKSRRKAPVFWHLGVPSGRYSVWCYAHRLTPDSLFALSRDLVAPKLALEERRRTALLQEVGSNPTAKLRAELAVQDAVVEELRAFAEELRRVAPLWNPDLDDGIVLVSAPLWRLVPHRAWQKELKSRWDDLAEGRYDWAHLAMHLWPERVVPKCADDRSLAIAHGLEDVFWAEGTDGKWAKPSRPSRSVEDLVAERISPAVKAALADLLAAPAPAGARGRGRAGE